MLPAWFSHTKVEKDEGETILLPILNSLYCSELFSSYQAVLLMVSSVDWTDIMTNSLGKVKRVAFNWVMADSCREINV